MDLYKITDGVVLKSRKNKLFKIIKDALEYELNILDIPIEEVRNSIKDALIKLYPTLLNTMCYYVDLIVDEYKMRNGLS